MFRLSQCPVCGSPLVRGFETQTPAGPMQVHPCPRCLSHVKSPFFEDAELREIYRRYALHEARYVLPPGEVEALRSRILRIERSVRAPGRLLEIGCGRGFMLAQALERGWDAQGLELGGGPENHFLPELVGRIRLIESEADYAQLESESYDAICSYQVFEHGLGDNVELHGRKPKPGPGQR